MSRLPKQLQRQVEEIDRIQKEIAGPTDPDPNPDAPPPNPETPPETPPTPVEVPPPTPVVDDWEQRYRSLEGKYRAEVPRLHQQVRDLQSSIEDLKAARAQPTPPTAPPTPATPQARQRLVTDKDAETFGPDLLDLIKRQAQEIATDMVSSHDAAVQAEIKRLATENETLKARLGDVSKSQETTAQDTYLSKLAIEVPDWSEINTDPGFLQWLSEVDPFTGMARQAYLDAAFKALDVKRTSVLFNAYKATKAPPAAPTPPPPKVTELQRQVTPGKTKSTAAPPAEDPSKKIWTTTEIQDFYTKVRQNKLTQDEAIRIEQEINSAVSTGRVR